MRNFAYVTLAAIGLLMTTLTAMAANPADLTSDFRLCPIQYYKAVYDDGPWYLLAIEPIGKDASVLFCNWNTERCTSRQYELAVTKRFSQTLQASIVHDLWDGEVTENQTYLMVDFSAKGKGLGFIVPLHPDGDIRVGPRAKVTDTLTAYVTVANNSSAMKGVSYQNKGLQVDLTNCEKTWWFRVSKKYGKFIPELRTKFTKEENFIGFGIAYCPD